MGSGKYKTRRRYDQRGHARLVNFACFQNQALLSNDRTRNWMIEAIDQARTKHVFHLWAWIIMPDHVHLLLFPAPGSEMGAILRSMKQSVANRVLAWTRKHAPEFSPKLTDARGVQRFWQRGGGYDRNLWSPRHIWEAVDYIHLNPVKAGLCDGPFDWEWSSAQAYRNSNADGRLRLDLEHLPQDPR